MKKTIWLDMDGTFVDLYGVNNWLDYIIAEDETPYKVAKPIGDMDILGSLLNTLQKQGWKIGIVTWLAKNSKEDYSHRVAQAKREWLNNELENVSFDYIDIIEYGQAKQNNRNGILFDDEEHNRVTWNGRAYYPQEMIEVLKGLIK